MDRVLSARLILVYLGLLLAVVVGGVLGVALGIWVAALWDVAVIGAVLLVLRQRAKTREEKLTRHSALSGSGCRDGKEATSAATGCKLLIERASKGWLDRYRSYDVIVNGKLRAELPRGGKQQIAVDPGPIEVYLKIDWCRSRVVKMNLDPGSEARIFCRPRSLLTGLYGITFGRDNYVQLEAPAASAHR